MRESPLRLVKQFAEYVPKERIKEVPTNRRGLYVLYNQVGDHYDVVYVGIGRRGIKSRLKSHAKSERKAEFWTHFSAFEVWQNIRDEEIVELEGLLRHIFRNDRNANSLGIQRTFKKLVGVKKELTDWSRRKAQN